jgi:hypothetical protein
MNGNLPPSLDRFAAELEQAIGRELGRRNRRLPRALHARSRLLAGTTLGAAATGVLLAIVLSTAGSSPAFAVTRNRDGSYSVKLRSLSAIPQVNRELSKLGLHAVLVPTGEKCPTPPQRYAVPIRLLSPPGHPPRYRVYYLVSPPHPALPTRTTGPAPAPSPPPYIRIAVCGTPPIPSSR